MTKPDEGIEFGQFDPSKRATVMVLSEQEVSRIKKRRQQLLELLADRLPDFYLYLAEEIISKGEQEKLIEEYKKIHLEATELYQIIFPLDKAEKIEHERLRERVRVLMQPLYQ